MQDGDTVIAIATENAGFNGAGDVVSTGADMTRWLSMLLNEGTFEGKEFISPDVMHEILASTPAIGTGGGRPLHDPNGLTQMGSDSYYFVTTVLWKRTGPLTVSAPSSPLSRRKILAFLFLQTRPDGLPGDGESRVPGADMWRERR